MDIINDGILWKHIIDSIAKKYGKPSTSGIQFATEADLILCDDRIAAECIADFLEVIGYDVATTGIWDVECGTTWYYIDIN